MATAIAKKSKSVTSPATPATKPATSKKKGEMAERLRAWHLHCEQHHYLGTERELALNNAIGLIEEACSSNGIALYLTTGREDKAEEVTVTFDVESESKFQFCGDTDQTLITGVIGAVSILIGKLTCIYDIAVGLKPSPLPSGLWVTRNRKGEIVEEGLYPCGGAKRDARKLSSGSPLNPAFRSPHGASRLPSRAR